VAKKNSGGGGKKAVAVATNTERRSGKAWKVRPCGQRHDPAPCGRGKCKKPVKTN